ncbi:translation initiation factor eIF4e [Hyphopichia burtonii NRRL Y-1933]|uniref:Translation initiation factor eIF4e n=1 Tax=Hyphopichia burtonii NRRL Y-1933 TaxID=984485 RepID=A0A1E4RJD8_9ASCO|nr:translation initiation factor eIF4e [Hyphopichia burtonii NRRL Y-1933]ODV67363.1 translation initiation factor eIF4e [Hyphopichia burtonii NRRL Y-1933]
MSENLKRAESLFNRIMNQSSGKNETIGSSKTSSYANAAAAAGSMNSNRRTSLNGHHRYNSGGSHNGTSEGKYNKSRSSSGSGPSGITSPLIGSTSSTFSDNGGRHHHNRHHNNHSKNEVPSVELPKRDPIKVSKETLLKIPNEHHILPYCWTIWHHSRNKSKQVMEEPISETNNAVAVDSYLQTTNEINFKSIIDSNELINSIGSLEQLWLSLSTIKQSHNLPIGTELLFFKSGINPVWEDPINSKGGRWVFRFSRRSHHQDNLDSIAKVRYRTNLIWERLLIKTITGSIIPKQNYSQEIQDLLLNDISGLVLSVRKDEDIISIWNSNINFNKKKFEENGEKSKKILTSFQARRIICDSILRIIRECDLINQGSDCIDTLDSGSNERVFGVSFEYRLHADNNNPSLHDKEKSRSKFNW